MKAEIFEARRRVNEESGRRESNPRSQLGNPTGRPAVNGSEQKAQVSRLTEQP
jgi:hypothetical protein